MKPRSIEALAVDVGVGLSLLSWAILGLRSDDGPPIEARAIAAALNATVGLLFLARRPAIAHGSIGAALRAIPSALVLGVAWRLSPHTGWPWWSLVLTCAGAVLAVASLATLGRSFAVLPARRALVERGPYRWVRHPAYLGEIVVAAGVGSASGPLVGVLVTTVLVALIVPRIADEEAILAADPAHAAYRDRVRWRLVPRVY